MALGSVGTEELAPLGDTLYDRFRGPDGADGGGVCIRGTPEGRTTSDRGDAKGGRGDTEAWAGDIRDARGPVGGFNSANLEACDIPGETGWIRVGRAGATAGDIELDEGRKDALASGRDKPGPVGAELGAARFSSDLTA